MDIRRWIRERVALVLDQLPWTCWTMLVVWYEFGGLRDLLAAFGNGRCRLDAVQPQCLGTCWCHEVVTARHAAECEGGPGVHKVVLEPVAKEGA